MQPHSEIQDLHAQGTTLYSSIKARIDATIRSMLGSDLKARVLSRLHGLAEALRVKAPLLGDLWHTLADWAGQTRERLRGIDYGARAVQTVGVAVVLGTLYLAVWGAGPRPYSDAREVIAVRTAPIGTLSLSDTGSPRIAEQSSQTEASASSM